MSSHYTAFAALKVELRGSVLTITLDNPPLNALTAATHDELSRIWHMAGVDPDVRAIVITGSGDRAFCAGGDLNRLLEHREEGTYWQKALAEARAIVLAQLECPKPIISRINGHAMGFGATIALAGDITIMVDDAKIGDAHISVGLTTGIGGTVLWPDLIGTVEARRLLFSGKPLSGREAEAKGLVTEAVQRSDLNAAVQGWIDRFLAQSPNAVASTKQALNLGTVAKVKAFADDMSRLQTLAWQSPNHPEAVRAILEKRAPDFVRE